METPTTNPKATRRTPKKKNKQSNIDLCSQELKDKETALKKELSDLNDQIKQLKKEGITVDVSEQMEALHRYNDIRDTTLTVLNYLSNATNESIADLHKKYDLPLD